MLDQDPAGWRLVDLSVPHLAMTSRFVIDPQEPPQICLLKLLCIKT